MAADKPSNHANDTPDASRPDSGAAQPTTAPTTPPSTATQAAKQPEPRDPVAEAKALAALEAELLGDAAPPAPAASTSRPAPTAHPEPPRLGANKAGAKAGAKADGAAASSAGTASVTAGRAPLEPANARKHVVEFRNVTKRYGDFTAIRDVSFAIEDHPNRGEFVSILGPSGCGKSTVIRMIAGLAPQFPQTEGEVLIDGHTITGPGADRGMVFQDYTSFDHMSVLENVAFGLRCRGMDKSSAYDKARHWIAKVGLSISKDQDKYPHELSGGMRQRVAIARTLILEPRIILMDEPFGALDPPTRSRMQDNLVSLWREQSPTVFFITHSIEEAVYLGDTILIFSNSPGTVLKTMRVPPPTKPSTEMHRDPQFRETVQEIRDLIDKLESSSRAGD